jgi:alpha-L-fucosidase
VNGRLVRNAAANFGDYKNTADRPAEFYPVTGDWEAIPTTNESYGYHKYDNSHKPASFFVQLLAKAASKGGNLLMNIGPKGDGNFDAKDLRILDSIGKWMDVNSESIYGVKASPLPLQSWGVTTQKENKLYLHVFNWPADGKLYVGGLKSHPNHIYLLSNKTKKLSYKRLNKTDLYLTVPTSSPDAGNAVIVMEYKTPPQTDSTRYLAPNISTHRLLAFDAELQGKGLSFGDGKAERYYVENWSQGKGQSIQWKFRTARKAVHKIEAKYTVPENWGGSFMFLTSGYGRECRLTDTSKGKVITEVMGEVMLGAGVHEITITPLTIKPAGLMRLLEINLIELKN